MVLVIEIDKNPKTVEKKKQRSVVIDSDSEEEIVQPKAVKKVIKQTVIKPDSFFSNSKISQKQGLVKKKEVVEIEDDYFNDDMDADLAQVDLEKFETEADMQFLKVVPKDIVVPTVETVPETVPEKRKLPMGMQTSPPKKLKTEPTLKKEAKPITPKKQATPKVTPKVTPKKITPIKDATKTPTTEETAEAPKAKFNYFQYQAKKASHQANVIRPQPIGAPDCLNGKTFVFTGDLLSLTREASQDIVKRYGGYFRLIRRVTSAPSKKTSFMVVGQDPGPSKMEKAKNLGIQVLSEDEFYDLINATNPNGSSEQVDVVEPAQPPVVVETKKVVQPIKQEPKPIKTTSFYQDQPKDKGKRPMVQHVLSDQLWTEKYKPTKYDEIIGNKGLVEKLAKWLREWSTNHKNHFPKGGKDDTGQFRAALLSGPPGIGKTTAAHMVAKFEGFEAIEFNASDTRSKKTLEANVKEATHCGSIMDLFSGKKAQKTKKVLIMDEVDGMSGGDRGGSAELIQIIKKSGIPIICLCNDRASPKIRSLAGHCVDLRFRRPTAQQVEVRLKKIAEKEKLTLLPNAIGELVQSTSGDIRQILNLLSTYRLSADRLSFDDSKRIAQESEKNISMSPFDVIGKLMGQATFRSSSMAQKIDYYFQDYSLMPLFVQENYVRMKPSMATDSKQSLKLLAEAADSISMGDLLDASQRNENSWSLLPLHAVMSTVRPCFFTHGAMQGMYNFPGWLGQNSKQSKANRLLREVQQKMKLKASADKSEIRLQYLPTLSKMLTKPMVEKETEGIEEVIERMDNYYLNREDWDNIMELGYQDLIKQIPTKNKSAFTRMYNKGSHPSPFAMTAAKGKGGGSFAMEMPDCEDVLVEDDQPNEEEEEEGEEEVEVVQPKKASKRQSSSKQSTSKTTTKKLKK